MEKINFRWWCCCASSMAENQLTGADVDSFISLNAVVSWDYYIFLWRTLLCFCGVRRARITFNSSDPTKCKLNSILLYTLGWWLVAQAVDDKWFIYLQNYINFHASCVCLWLYDDVQRARFFLPSSTPIDSFSVCSRRTSSFASYLLKLWNTT